MKKTGAQSKVFDNKLQLEVVKAAVVSAITGLIGFLITSLLNINSDLKPAIVGVSVFIGYIIITFIQKKVTNFSEEIGKKFVEEQTGIVKVYENLEDCKEDMRTDFRASKDIRMLLQIGRREFGDGEASYFIEDSKAKKNTEDKIRILRGGGSSPFFSEKRAAFRKNNVNRWREDTRRLQTEINLLRETGVCIFDREHSEPFLWRIFLFDEIAYVSGYLHPRDNDRMAVVYKIKKGDNSLFPVFERYFEYLWKKYDPALIGINPDDIWKDWI